MYAQTNGNSFYVKTKLGISESTFTINDQLAFLYGISYYGALGASRRSIRQDLTDIKRYKFNWIRVWVNWAGGNTDISAVDDEGFAVKPYMDKLKWLVGQCNRRGIIVDITLAHGNNKDGRSLKTIEAHQHAVKSVISALGLYKNWYLDLANEHDVKDDRYVSFNDLKDLRALCQALDNDLPVTASAGDDISNADLEAYLETVKVDFISPHRPRNEGSAMQTASKTREYIREMEAYGHVIPVHYQEPFRRGYTIWQPDVDDYIADLKGAITGGAGGWCFHNGDQKAGKDQQPQRSFDMHKQRLFGQLDKVELLAIQTIARQIIK
ncbi:hypothetical protein [Mucilaginibacter sp. dw_454]|uniref:hypothetical protein n=1 Tax=Mucilaginibacter sp. dw_454 TaxID=2720079 RepID=UPI001BD24D59|nr:hypothetical protein [Mucilaginibacter sp. dw_454]